VTNVAIGSFLQKARDFTRATPRIHYTERAPMKKGQSDKQKSKKAAAAFVETVSYCYILLGPNKSRLSIVFYSCTVCNFRVVATAQATFALSRAGLFGGCRCFAGSVLI